MTLDEIEKLFRDLSYQDYERNALLGKAAVAIAGLRKRAETKDKKVLELREQVHDLEILIDVKSEDLDEATAKVRELQRQVAELEADAKRIAFLFSGIRTTSNALVELELRLINGEAPSLDAVRAAIDDAMMAALNTETTG